MKHPFYVYAMRDERDGSGSYDIQADVRVSERAWAIVPTEHVRHYVNICLTPGHVGWYRAEIDSSALSQTVAQMPGGSVKTDVIDGVMVAHFLIASPWDRFMITVEFTDTFTPVVFAPVYLTYVRGLTITERVRNFINTLRG